MPKESITLKFCEVEWPDQPENDFGSIEPAYDDTDTCRYEKEFELDTDDYEFDFEYIIHYIKTRIGDNWEPSSSHFNEHPEGTWISGSTCNIYTGIMTEYSVHYVNGSIEIWTKILNKFK